MAGLGFELRFLSIENLKIQLESHFLGFKQEVFDRGFFSRRETVAAVSKGRTNAKLALFHRSIAQPHHNQTTHAAGTIDFDGNEFRRSQSETIRRFQATLRDQDIVTTTRKTRGDDIDAACGQLAGKVRDRVRVRLSEKNIKVATA